MATPAKHSVESLSLDLGNFRHLPQSNESDAIRAIIAIDQDRFWALAKSLLEDGYHPTDNILLLKTGKTLTVKEGNRRIAAIKLILGILKIKDLDIPANIQAEIKSINRGRKGDLKEVPCLEYGSEEIVVLDKVLTRIHGKGDKASRTEWTAVAKARHARMKKASSEPGLDLLEIYLESGKNFTKSQKEKWAGDYPLTVLDEALKKLAPMLKLKTRREVTEYFKKGKLKDKFEDMLFAIGEGTLTFKKLRDENPLSTKYGFPALASDPATPDTSADPTGSTTTTAGASGGKGTGTAGPMVGSTTASQGAWATSQSATKKKSKALALNDPQSVIQQLKKFKPVGANRGKVTSLVKEAITLSLEADGQPHAFCFLLRSMFEISAKAYCDDYATDPNGPKATKAGGEDRKLADILKDVTDHLKKTSQDKGLIKRLHGAVTELSTPEGILSVTSMNQLVHNSKFSVTGAHISTVLNNIFPLLEALNS